MGKNKKVGLNAEATEETVNPLSLQLDKKNHLADDSEADAAKLDPKEAKRISQKKFADTILKRVNERIAQRGNRQSQFPKLGIIFFVLFAAPLFLRAGNDMYDLLKSKLPYYLEFYGIDFPSAPVIAEHGDLDSKVAIDKFLKLQEKMLKKSAQKVVIIYPERSGTFSLKREKKKLYEISGLDIDDPVKSSGVIGKIRSLELLVAMVESFDRILDSAGENGKVSGFHVKNAIEGKRLALARIRQLR